MPRPVAKRGLPAGKALAVLSASALCAAALGRIGTTQGRRAFEVTFTRPGFNLMPQAVLGDARARHVHRVAYRDAFSSSGAVAVAAKPEEGFGAAASLAFGEATTPPSLEAVSQIMGSWLQFLRGDGQGVGTSSALASSELLADASGFPLEQALELFAEGGRKALAGATVLTAGLPEGVPATLGPVGWIAAVRNGEDLDLGLYGGKEWHTLHLDMLAANPLLGWASGAAKGGKRLLRKLLGSAAACGRAVTVQPLSEQLREEYRRLGFQEDALLDPSLMFWVPSEGSSSAVDLRETSYFAC